MSDFESGAFNRALPPLRLFTNLISYFAHLCVSWLSPQNLRFPKVVSLGSFAITRRSTSLLIRSEKGTAACHLERPVPKQFRDGPLTYTGHKEFTCKSMAVAMPAGTLDLPRFKRDGETSHLNFDAIRHSGRKSGLFKATRKSSKRPMCASDKRSGNETHARRY